MRAVGRIKSLSLATTVTSVLALAGVIGLSSVAIAGDEKKADSAHAEGKKLAFDKKKGNCLACHLIAGGEQAGNIGPPLIGMKARFPDRAVLRAQVFDARVKNPNTIMIPFGPHGVLSEKEIDKVVDFIYSL
jgi:sulfur-oxidizing protein SoxX